MEQVLRPGPEITPSSPSPSRSSQSGFPGQACGRARPQPPTFPLKALRPQNPLNPVNPTGRPWAPSAQKSRLFLHCPQDTCVKVIPFSRPCLLTSFVKEVIHLNTDGRRCRTRPMHPRVTLCYRNVNLTAVNRGTETRRLGLGWP